MTQIRAADLWSLWQPPHTSSCGSVHLFTCLALASRSAYFLPQQSQTKNISLVWAARRWRVWCLAIDMKPQPLTGQVTGPLAPQCLSLAWANSPAEVARVKGQAAQDHHPPWETRLGMLKIQDQT